MNRLPVMNRNKMYRRAGEDMAHKKIKKLTGELVLMHQEVGLR